MKTEQERNAEAIEKVINAVLSLIFGFIFGSIATNYLLHELLGQSLNFWQAGLIGVIGYKIIVPIAVVYWLLSQWGIL